MRTIRAYDILPTTSIIIYRAERNYARRNDDNRRMLSAQYIYTRRYIYTKISVILPGTKAALVLREPEVESRRRRAEIYLATRRDFVFVGARREKKEEKEVVEGMGHIF